MTSAVASGAHAVETFLASFFRLDPVTATFAGAEGHDHALPDWSPEGLARAAAERRELLEPFGASREVTDEACRRRQWGVIDSALAAGALEIALSEDASGHFVRGNPSLAIGEAVFGLVSLAWTGPVNRRAMDARMAALPAFLAGVSDTLGATAVPAPWKERALRECEGARLLLEDLVVSSMADASIARAARQAVDAFAGHVSGLPDASPESMAVGGVHLGLVLRQGHWCDTPVDALIVEARDGLRFERARLTTGVTAAGASGWAEVAERLAADHPDPDHVVEECRATWANARDVAADQVTWPDVPVLYEPMPPWARRAAPFLYYLMYRSPTTLDYPATDRYAIPVPEPEARESFQRTWTRAAIKLNHVAHHGGLGHHVQNWYAASAPSRIGRIAAVDGASRIAMACGGTMAEGWACYATEVMEGLGWLSPDERLSEHHTRVRLLARAVVDLELHTGRLSFANAEQLFMEATGMTAVQARGEVTKVSMFPGMASMYWLGLRGLRALRDAEEARRGTAFDARSFHDEVLSFGSIPVPLVARLMVAGRPS